MKFHRRNETWFYSCQILGCGAKLKDLRSVAKHQVDSHSDNLDLDSSQDRQDRNKQHVVLVTNVPRTSGSKEFYQILQSHEISTYGFQMTYLPPTARLRFSLESSALNAARKLQDQSFRGHVLQTTLLMEPFSRPQGIIPFYDDLRCERCWDDLSRTDHQSGTPPQSHGRAAQCDGGRPCGNCTRDDAVCGDSPKDHVRCLPKDSRLVKLISPVCPLCKEAIGPLSAMLELSPKILGRHIGRHMEEISFAVVTKPYEDWDFYDGSSASSRLLPATENRPLETDHAIPRGECLVNLQPKSILKPCDSQLWVSQKRKSNEQNTCASAVPKSLKSSMD
jgi:hypothetical protein